MSEANLAKYAELFRMKVESPIDGKEITFRKYLKLILETMWQEGESFNGKRPFGDGGWQWDIYKRMIECKIIEGTLDEEGFIEKLDHQAAKALVIAAIRAWA